MRSTVPGHSARPISFHRARAAHGTAVAAHRRAVARTLFAGLLVVTVATAAFPVETQPAGLRRSVSRRAGRSAVRDLRSREGTVRVDGAVAVSSLATESPGSVSGRVQSGAGPESPGSGAPLRGSGQDSGAQHELRELEFAAEDLLKQLGQAAIRLPLATALGALLALRPRRRGTPVRNPAVVQTQIVLAIVGAVVMLIVGASLARAFGIVGVASLVRYRSKIDDPKDAVVMLSALAVGLASGVGLYALAISSALFLVAALWVIESFEPQTRVFELTIKLGKETSALRPSIEAVLRRFKTTYELRGSSEEEVSYIVTAPRAMSTDRASEALAKLAADGKGAVEWSEKPKKNNPN